MWHDERVWEAPDDKSYDDAHDELDNDDTAKPFEKQARAKCVEETRPQIDRMRGPMTEVEARTK